MKHPINPRAIVVFGLCIWPWVYVCKCNIRFLLIRNFETGITIVINGHMFATTNLLPYSSKESHYDS
jgi:hypothetical protein